MKIQPVVAGIVLVAALSAAQQSAAPAADRDVVVLAAKILDPVSGKYTAPSAIVVRGTRIAKVIRSRSHQAVRYRLADCRVRTT